MIVGLCVQCLGITSESAFWTSHIARGIADTHDAFGDLSKVPIAESGEFWSMLRTRVTKFPSNEQHQHHHDEMWPCARPASIVVDKHQ